QMTLLLEKHICCSSINVFYLPTNLSEARSYAILTAFMIKDNENNLYLTDMIQKYFACPIDPEFNQLTYPNYW
ncbi:16283_t:CDS:1, partial [Cetraspora pellucida]